MCGFIGVIGVDAAVREIYDGLVAIQHRGQDSAGIITYDGRFHVKKGEGLVRDIFSAANIERLKGDIAVGHVRYPTVGSGGGEDAQPFTVNYPFGIVMAHNGNVANYEDLKDDLEDRSLRILYSGCDVEVILNVFAGALAKYAKEGFSLGAYHEAVREVYRTVRGFDAMTGELLDEKRKAAIREAFTRFGTEAPIDAVFLPEVVAREANIHHGKARWDGATVELTETKGGALFDKFRAFGGSVPAASLELRAVDAQVSEVFLGRGAIELLVRFKKGGLMSAGSFDEIPPADWLADASRDAKAVDRALGALIPPPQ